MATAGMAAEAAIGTACATIDGRHVANGSRKHQMIRISSSHATNSLPLPFASICASSSSSSSSLFSFLSSVMAPTTDLHASGDNVDVGLFGITTKGRRDGFPEFAGMCLSKRSGHRSNDSGCRSHALLQRRSSKLFSAGTGTGIGTGARSVDGGKRRVAAADLRCASARGVTGPVAAAGARAGDRDSLTEARGKIKRDVVVDASSVASSNAEGEIGIGTETVESVGGVDQERLVPRVAKQPEGYYLLKEDYRKGINPIEKLKIDKEPMKIVVEDRINELRDINFEELDSTKQGKDEIDMRLKWLGLFHKRKHQYGRFMMRLKLPNGVTTSEQTRFLASCIEKYGSEGCADVTTRQNWQIRGVVLQDVPDIMTGLQEVGLTSLQSGMDNVRNPVGNPLAGIDPAEIIDTRPFNQALSDYITGDGNGNLEITNLPRKWNVCVIGSHDLYEHPHINDLAYMPAMKNGVMGFNILVGGFFSPKRCEEAIPLDAWVSETDVVPLCHAVLTTFRDLGARSNRQKCRMMWLIEDLGLECFRAEVEKRMPSKNLERAAPNDLIDPSWERRDYFGVHPQKQKGLNYVGIHIPVGRVQASDMFELARIADEYGTGELRLTVEQNMIIPNVPDAKVDALLREALLKQFTPTPSKFMSGLVACTGNQFCSLALIETKQAALNLTRALEETMEVPRAVRMHWTGCPNTCGQVQVADIGFLGCAARDENRKLCDGVDIFIGGRIGSDSHLGTVLKSAVPMKNLLPIVQDLLIEHFGATRKVVHSTQA